MTMGLALLIVTTPSSNEKTTRIDLSLRGDACTV